MGLSFVIDKIGWGGTGGVKILCISNSSQGLSNQCSKRWLSQQTIYTIV
jgi:hypothetical protein